MQRVYYKHTDWCATDMADGESVITEIWIIKFKMTANTQTEIKWQLFANNMFFINVAFYTVNDCTTDTFIWLFP